ncbi:MAG: PKD domain-containing protein [Gammaproteobacteria bacterium]|nr:PKD domain-containing protein [Gammaproteobacteria bacterium]
MKTKKLLAGVLIGMGALTWQSVSAAGMQDAVSTQPVGTWLKVNKNLFQSVWPASGQKPAGYPAAKIDAWNSGGYDPATGDFFVLGGDDLPYVGNEVYRFNGQTLMWQRDSLPSAIVAPDGVTRKIYLTVDGPDGSPMAGETFENVVFLPNVRRLALLGGDAWPGDGLQYFRGDGVTRTGPYFFDPLKADPNKVGGLPGSQWNAASYPNVQAGYMWENRQSVQTAAGLVGPKSLYAGVSAITTVNGKDVAYVGETPSGVTGAMGRLFRYTVNSLAPGDDTWEVVGVPVLQSYTGPGAGSLDAQREAFTRTSTTRLNAYNPATDTIVGAIKPTLMYWNLKTAGPTNNIVFVPQILGDTVPLGPASGLEYNPDIDAYLVWEGNKDVWFIYPPNQQSPDGWFARKVSTTGDGPVLGGFPYTGIYGKWVNMPGLSAMFGLVQPFNGDVWIYKPDPALANPKAPATYTPGFRPNGSGGLELYVADPANPGTPIVIAGTLPTGADAKSVVVPHGSNLGPRIATALHNRALVFAIGNSLYKVDLRQAGSQMPVQLSSENQAGQLCGFPGVAADYQNPDRSAVVYTLPGADGNCATSGDNDYRLVRMDMTAADAPLPVKRPITAVYDNSHAHVGWLATDGAGIVLTDAAFQSPIAVGAFSGNSDNVQALGVDTANNVVMLKIDAQLRAFNKLTNTLGAPIYTFLDAARPVLFAQDEYNTYFVDRGTSASTLRRVRSDGSALALLVASETTPILTAPKLFVNSGRLAYLLQSATAGLASVRVVNKLGGTPANYVTNVANDFLEVSYNNAFYNVPSGTGFKAGKIQENGSNKVELVNARWAGALLPTSGDTANVRPVRLVRVDRAVSDRDAGGTVNVIDPTTSLVLRNQGTLPLDSLKFSLVRGPGAAYAGSTIGASTSIYPGTAATSFHLDSEGTGTITPLGAGVQVSGGNIAPIVVLTATPPAGFTTTSFQFDASGSFDPDGGIASFDWNFGDNTFGTGLLASHTFANPGSYTVQVTATDVKGAQSQGSIGITVQQYVPLEINLGSVELKGTVSDPSVTQIVVNGTVIPVENGMFDVQVPVGTGTTTVTLQVTGTQGTVTKTVTIGVQ